ncbi:efflux RND transporter periplasmic adaptor subunit [Ruminococcaceae bacterium OttesenSCG-928-L11]|nr:efflux RND transporter periplasmic adaptor subunit [Ruminococcaceae bacterium OttesenSCG-928-L11]
MAIEKRKRKKWKIVAAVAVIAVAAAGIGMYNMQKNAGPIHPFADTTPLTRMDLRNMVNVTGTVKSTQTKKVYTQLTYPVEALSVQVGDVVAEGDILCQLDTQSLEDAITDKTTSINKSAQSANQKLADAQRTYSIAQTMLEKDMNSELMAAQSTLRRAEVTMQEMASDLINSRNEMQDARDIEDSEALEQYKFASRKAQLAYDSSKEAVAEAKANLKVVEETIKQRLEEYQTEIQKAKVDTDLSDQWLAVTRLQEDIEKCTIKSPVSGVVTAVYATEGASASGLMFVIEDTDSLKIGTRVKEYDIAAIELGNYVEIKSDATGDDVYDGKLEKIAPTSVKTATGDIDTSSDVEFEAEVSVQSSQTNLKIGMKTRMNIVYEEKQQVLAVPYEAIAYNQEGATVVYVAKIGEDGLGTVESVAVETGMENDFYVEVISSDLTEGDLIITNIDAVAPGMQVTTVDPMAMAYGGPIAG